MYVIFCQKREVNTILNDIIKHLTPDRAFEDFYPQLQSVVSKILVHMTDFSLLFSLVSYLCCEVEIFLSACYALAYDV